MVFHFADKISSFREVANMPEKRLVLEKMEKSILDKSALATCSSQSIYDYVLEISGGDSNKVKYLPHAVKASAFFDETVTSDIPEDLAALPGPIAGYFGSLTQTNDKETFLAAARALPEWSFVFIGRVLGDYSDLESQPNVHFLGPRPHSLIPAYGQGFDVCFMGWRAHEWISNCFPLKTLEYLALEKPIVCAGRIDELMDRFPAFVRTTESAQEFIRALVEEHEQDNSEKRSQRGKAVGNETWDRRVEDIMAGLAAQGVDYA